MFYWWERKRKLVIILASSQCWPTRQACITQFLRLFRRRETSWIGHKCSFTLAVQAQPLQHDAYFFFFNNHKFIENVHVEKLFFSVPCESTIATWNPLVSQLHQCVFPKNKNILLHNYSMAIKMQKLILTCYCHLICRPCSCIALSLFQS